MTNNMWASTPNLGLPHFTKRTNERTNERTNGTERNGTERNGTERNGTERNGTERNGTERNGTEQNRTVLLALTWQLSRGQWRLCRGLHAPGIGCLPPPPSLQSYGTLSTLCRSKQPPPLIYSHNKSHTTVVIVHRLCDKFMSGRL